MTALRRWLWCLAILTVTILAAFLRIYRLEGSLLYSDQAFCWRVASRDLSGLLAGAAGDTHPPGYFLLLKAWMAVFGDSPFALRALSALVGTACVPAMYSLCGEAFARGRKVTGRERAGALTAAALMAVHYIPVEASRIARMYPCGLLMTIVSTWLLLRTLRAERRHVAWWLIYGIATALLAYSHNYVLFTILAQWTFVIGRSCRQYIARKGETQPAVAGLVLAVGTAAALYLPWLSAFAAQATRVHTRFWIPPLTMTVLETTFLSWFSGIGYWDGTVYLPAADATFRVMASLVWLYLLGFEFMVMWAVSRKSEAGWLFVLLALVPWLCALVISQWSGRPILQPRYLTFATVGLFGLVGLAVATLPWRWSAWTLAGGMLGLSMYGTWTFAARFAPGPPAIDSAAAYLRDNMQPDDVIIVSRPKRLLELRYHAHRVGMDELDVRCPIELDAGGGHTNLASALTDADRLWERAPANIRRVWIAADDDGTRISGWEPAGDNAWQQHPRQTWKAPQDWEEPSYSLTLFERKRESPAAQRK